MNEKVVTLWVTVGLPGAGKTTRARELQEQNHALRLTKDDWVIALFGADDWWTAEAIHRSDVIEGRLISIALSALRLGTNVVLDFGVWSREERSALKHLAAKVGAACELIYLPVGAEEQKQRLDVRYAADPSSNFAMGDYLAEFRQKFQEPNEGELQSSDAGPPPARFSSWEEWARDRWPTALAES